MKTAVAVEAVVVVARLALAVLPRFALVAVTSAAEVVAARLAHVAVTAYWFLNTVAFTNPLCLANGTLQCLHIVHFQFGGQSQPKHSMPACRISSAIDSFANNARLILNSDMAVTCSAVRVPKVTGDVAIAMCPELQAIEHGLADDDFFHACKGIDIPDATVFITQVHVGGHV